MRIKDIQKTIETSFSIISLSSFYVKLPFAGRHVSRMRQRGLLATIYGMKDRLLQLL